MCYADTCYILALVLPNDVWRPNAEHIRKQAQAENRKVWASETTFHELLMLAGAKGYDPVRCVRDVLGLVLPDRVQDTTLLKAAMFVKNKGFEPADALITAHAVDAGLRLITADRFVQAAVNNIDGLSIINLRSSNAML